MKKITFTVLTLLLSFASMKAQEQVFLQEDFNNGFPPGWQSNSFVGNNQWQIPPLGGPSIDGIGYDVHSGNSEPTIHYRASVAAATASRSTDRYCRLIFHLQPTFPTEYQFKSSAVRRSKPRGSNRTNGAEPDSL